VLAARARQRELRSRRAVLQRPDAAAGPGPFAALSAESRAAPGRRLRAPGSLRPGLRPRVRRLARTLATSTSHRRSVPSTSRGVQYRLALHRRARPHPGLGLAVDITAAPLSPSLFSLRLGSPSHLSAGRGEVQDPTTAYVKLVPAQPHSIPRSRPRRGRAGRRPPRDSRRRPRSTWAGVREAVVNAMTHGNNLDPEGAVDVVLLAGEGNVTARVRDRARGSTPQDQGSPRPREPAPGLRARAADDPCVRGRGRISAIVPGVAWRSRS
jgi:hypothetical protein